jgi:hypothetical protein
VNVVYGAADGELAIIAQGARHMKILETMAELLAEQYLWPVPITLEFKACGESGAFWEFRTRRIIVCYEIVSEFSQLYRSYRKTDTFALDDMVLHLSEARKEHPRKNGDQLPSDRRMSDLRAADTPRSANRRGAAREFLVLCVDEQSQFLALSRLKTGLIPSRECHPAISNISGGGALANPRGITVTCTVA